MLRCVIREQLLRVLSYDTPTWVREHEPSTGLAAAKLAQQYLNAHRGGLPMQPSRGTVCSVSDNSDVVTERGRVEHASSGQGLRSTVEKGIISFYHQQPGHEASVCPARKATQSYVPREEDIAKDSVGESQTVCTITVNGHYLQVLLYTGCSLSLLKPCFVSNVSYVNTTSVQCVTNCRGSKVAGMEEQMRFFKSLSKTFMTIDVRATGR